MTEIPYSVLGLFTMVLAWLWKVVEISQKKVGFTFGFVGLYVLGALILAYGAYQADEMAIAVLYGAASVLAAAVFFTDEGKNFVVSSGKKKRR